MKRLGLFFAIGASYAILLAVIADWPLKLLSLAIVIGVLAALVVKIHRDRQALAELERLQSSFEQLDRQAKLIIRTDLELHRAQEELDRRLTSLMSLHQLGRELQVSPRPEEIFAKLDTAIVSSLGFVKGLLGMPQPDGTILWRSAVGIGEAETQAIAAHLTSTPLLTQLLAAPTPRLLDASLAAEPLQRRLQELLGVGMAVAVGLVPQSGPSGCLILGRSGLAHRADEELAAILAKQLTSAIENSALYEEAWTARQDLERKVHERTRQLEVANVELVRLNKAKSDFVSAVSHELRTPLAAIKGYASLLGTGQFGKLKEEQAERLAKIEKHADLLTQLINNLLDIARIESGRTAMERQPIALEQFMATVTESVRPQLDAKRLHYQVDRDGVEALVGDSQHLTRVFINLLSNAIKYTPEDGSVRVGFRQDGEMILATVSDTGRGMKEEELPKLFQEFYRANDPVNQQIRGTGLGLALVKRIVEAHGGYITVSSEYGKGTTFLIRLPSGSA